MKKDTLFYSETEKILFLTLGLTALQELYAKY